MIRGREAPEHRWVVLALLGAWVLAASGCAVILPYRTPTDVERWQTPERPTLGLGEKARFYQSRIESLHQMPDGLIRYKFRESDLASPGHGNLADGSFFLGIYLASQAHRHAATGDPEARAQVELSLAAMRLYAEVSDRRGLLARYYSPVRAEDDRWRRSASHPRYFWRSDVSKDQYAGYVHGLGVSLAVLRDPELREEAGALARDIASHLIENDLRVVDWDGEPTTYGDLRPRLAGFPVGVNALIALAIAKSAAVSDVSGSFTAFHEALIRDGALGTARWAHLTPPGSTKRVNYHMAYLALYPLLLLEQDPERLAALREVDARLWSRVRGERNAFFAFVHQVALAGPGAGPDDAPAVEEGRAGLTGFPDRKLAWPVDLTRPGFDLPRAFRLFSRKPRSREPVPIHLRTRSSNYWGHDPYRLVGRLDARGELEFAGIDYLMAYWLGRHHGFVADRD